ncbi:hypothetical protein C8Q80DRAFT_1271608 [Daedaleopsis nitida]|nr:hypothetical protein C8Q80DRAFT_1271608 [Daedaleopsis nitida]
MQGLCATSLPVDIQFVVDLYTSNGLTLEEELIPLEEDNERTREILDHLSGYPAFAGVVRTLTVRRHQFESEEVESSTCGALVGALKALPQLETFSWYGHRAMQTAQIPEPVMVALPSNMQIFRATISQRFPQLFSLPSPNTKLALILTDLDGWQDEVDDQAREAQVQRVYDSSAASLRELVAHCTLPVNTSLPALESLKAYLPYRFGIQNLFDHSTRLTSLSLGALFDGAEALFAAMEAAPDAFPHLTSFHLTVVTGDVPNFSCATIAAFLRPKRLLCRLLVNAEQDLDDAVPVLAELPRLEVLSFGCIIWENHELYQEYLPGRLTTQLVLELIRRLPAIRTLQLVYLPIRYNAALLQAVRTSAHPSLALVFLNQARSDVICQGSSRPAALCAHRDPIDRFHPGECRLIDDWLWLVPPATTGFCESSPAP